jgi:hypothetical protein
LFERNACALSGGQGTFASSGRARIARLTRVPVRSTGKEPSPEDGPPAQTGVFTRHSLNMQPLLRSLFPYLTSLLLRTQLRSTRAQNEEEEEEEEVTQAKNKKRINSEGILDVYPAMTTSAARFKRFAHP